MRVRTATIEDAAGIARVQVDTWRTTYAGIMPDVVLGQLSYDRSGQSWHRVLAQTESKSFIVIVSDDAGMIGGFSAAGPERTNEFGFAGEIYALYVLQTWQRHGAGRALVRATVERLIAGNIHDMLIWVLKANAIGRGFYESIGGVQAAERDIDIAGATLAEIGYGWRALPTWLTRWH